MWLNRFGVSGSSSKYRAFSPSAGWGYVHNHAYLLSNIKQMQLSKNATGCDNSQAQSDYCGEAGGNILTAIPANKKIYFEMRRAAGPNPGAFNAGFGLHNALSGSLGSQWIRSWRSGALASGDFEEIHTWDQMLLQKLMQLLTSNESDMRFAVDTINGRVWMSYGPSGTWYGGGDPAAGTSPSFNIDVTGWYIIYKENKMSLPIPALTGANTISQLVADVNSIKLLAANTVGIVANSTFQSTLANTNSYIATKTSTTTFNSALANTNTYI
jgi:hypothetical protein